jgi:hypothetical protein
VWHKHCLAFSSLSGTGLPRKIHQNKSQLKANIAMGLLAVHYKRSLLNFLSSTNHRIRQDLGNQPLNGFGVQAKTA